MEVHITKVNWKDTDKEGNKLQGKFGPYYKVGILTREHGEKWINGITSFIPSDWEGKTKELEIAEDPKWGWQFKLPKKEGSGRPAPAPDMNRVEVKLDAVAAQLATIGGILTDMKGVLGSLVKEKEGPGF